MLIIDIGMGLLNNRLEFKLYIMLAFLFTLISCQGQEEDYIKFYGKDFNQQRLDLSVPIIEDNWILHYYDSVYMYWSDPEEVISTVHPIHLLKRINLEDGKIISEEDEYHYKTTTDEAYRVVSVYSYEVDSAESRFITYFKGKMPPSSTRPLTQFHVDSILTSWGLRK